MNRQIKFRGKELIHNKWIFGGLAEDRNDNAVISPKANWQKGGCVDKDTIGQFTGLHDKNGKEIYEGDIIQFLHKGKKVTKSIKWGDDTCMFYYFPIDYHFLNKDLAGRCCVIGNIRDNPELIKEEGQ